MILVILRSILAQIIIFLGISVATLGGYVLTFVCSTKFMIRYLTIVIGITRWLVFKIVGVTVEYRGLHNIPATPCVFASKHQSLLETTFFFNTFKKYNVYAYKKEIAEVFLWGRLSTKFGGIRVDRKLGAKMVDNMVSQVKDYLNNNFDVTIFPEGTRVKAGLDGKFKKGIAKIYSQINYPIIPVALNSGLIVPKKSFLIYPTKLIIEFLPAIPTNLTQEDFLQQLQQQVNAKSQQLFTQTKHKYFK